MELKSSSSVSVAPVTALTNCHYAITTLSVQCYEMKRLHQRAHNLYRKHTAEEGITDLRVGHYAPTIGLYLRHQSHEITSREACAGQARNFNQRTLLQPRLRSIANHNILRQTRESGIGRDAHLARSCLHPRDELPCITLIAAVKLLTAKFTANFQNCKWACDRLDRAVRCLYATLSDELAYHAAAVDSCGRKSGRVWKSSRRR